MKLRPNTNSSGGRSAFGVVVSCIESFDGSNSASFLVEAASAWIEYNRRHVVAVLINDGRDVVRMRLAWVPNSEVVNLDAIRDQLEGQRGKGGRANEGKISGVLKQQLCSI